MSYLFYIQIKCTFFWYHERFSRTSSLIGWVLLCKSKGRFLWKVKVHLLKCFSIQSTCLQWVDWPRSTCWPFCLQTKPNLGLGFVCKNTNFRITEVLPLAASYWIKETWIGASSPCVSVPQLVQLSDATHCCVVHGWTICNGSKSCQEGRGGFVSGGHENHLVRLPSPWVEFVWYVVLRLFHLLWEGEALFLNVDCLYPHSSIFIASSHSRFADTPTANWFWSKGGI